MLINSPMQSGWDLWRTVPEVVSTIDWRQSFAPIASIKDNRGNTLSEAECFA